MEEIQRQALARSDLDAGVPVRFDLATPCRAFERGLRCDAFEAYIKVRPYGATFHYERRCINGHFVDNVKHSEVALHFGIPVSQGKSAVRDALTPPPRVCFNLLVRNESTCVYCGRRAGEKTLDGIVIVVGADHIIAKHLIDPEMIRRDRELLRFARDTQLVTACQFDNSAKSSMLLEFEAAREIFIRHVLRGKADGENRTLIAMFERLHRIVSHNQNIAARAAKTSGPAAGR
jgi:RNA polymerase subunit RPABC4/transcription elongation factor Spt4